MTKFGVIPDLSSNAYHDHPHIGSTTIARARRSMAHSRVPFESTKAMIFGSGFHALIGEPKLFAKKYVKYPEGLDRRTKQGKEDWVAFLSENKGKEIITHDEWQAMNGMLESILKHKTAVELLTNGVAEQSYFCTDEGSGVGIKCRPDYYRTNDIVVDLKTAEDASETAFQKTLLPYGRHIQTALYLDVLSKVTGREHKNFAHLVVEKKPPYAIGLYSLDDESIDQGRREYKKILTDIAFCQKIDEWPAYPEQIKAVSIPIWGFTYE